MKLTPEEGDELLDFAVRSQMVRDQIGVRLAEPCHLSEPEVLRVQKRVAELARPGKEAQALDWLEWWLDGKPRRRRVKQDG